MLWPGHVLAHCLSTMKPWTSHLVSLVSLSKMGLLLSAPPPMPRKINDDRDMKVFCKTQREIECPQGGQWCGNATHMLEPYLDISQSCSLLVQSHTSSLTLTKGLTWGLTHSKDSYSQDSRLVQNNYQIENHWYSVENFYPSMFFLFVCFYTLVKHCVSNTGRWFLILWRVHSPKCFFQ